MGASSPSNCYRYDAPIEPKQPKDRVRWIRDREKALRALVRQLNDRVCTCCARPRA